jgi:VanZ family protein
VEDPEAAPTARLNKLSVAAWLPAFAWAGLIFALSAQPDLTFVADQDIDFVVRKLGHMAIFGVLALLIWRALAGTRKWRFPWAWALVMTVFYAITDELHQAFVPGRNASGWDIGIDAVGALIAVVIVSIIGVWWPTRSAGP